MKKTVQTKLVSAATVLSTPFQMAHALLQLDKGVTKSPFREIDIVSQYTSCKKPILAVEPFMSKNKIALLVKVEHPYLQTLIDLTGINHMLVMSFEASGKFIGMNRVGKKSEAPFQVLNQGRIFLIMEEDVALPVSRIIGIKIK